MEQPPQPRPLATIWRVPDDLWAIIAPVLAELDPAKSTGRRRIPARGAMDAVIYRLRSGCQWNQLPAEFPDDSSVHRTFQRWVKKGVLERVWAVRVAQCAELGGVDWQWQSADCQLGKARMGGDQIGRNPTDRGKRGTKKVCWSKPTAGQ
jgi:putative transposase